MNYCVLDYASMIQYPDISPEIFQIPEIFGIGPIVVRWYGLMYLIGFVAAWWLGRKRAARPNSGWTEVDVEDLIFYGVVGVIVGGRLGYVFVYGLSDFLDDPRYLYRIWQGGMSFHGGLAGVLVAMWLFARRRGWPYFKVADFMAPLVPLGLGAGRIGNFINNELWGKVTDVPWAFVVNGVARHPSQLYEAFLEGFVMFAVLWAYTSRPRPLMAASGVFMILYGIFRFAVEFVRTPDQHLGVQGYLASDWLTMGQILSAPMIVVGVVWLWLAYNRAGSDSKAI